MANSSQPLSVDVAMVDGLPVVSPVGEVDIASVAVLRDVLDQQLDGGATRLVVNLEGLDYLDSTGLGCVTAARRKARDLGGDLVLVCTRERILRLFTITGLDQVFTICAQPADALQQLGEHSG